MLKAFIKDISEVDEKYRDLYTKTDDGYTLQVDEADFKKQLGEFRGNNITLTKQLTTLKEQMKKFEGVDTEKYAEAMETMRKLEEKQLIEAGKIDEVVNSRVDAMRNELGGKITALEERATKAEKAAGDYKSKLDIIAVDDTITKAIGEVAIPRKGAISDIINRARNTWRVDDEGKVIAMQGDQQIYGADGKAPITPQEWATNLYKDASYLFEPNSGGNAQGSGGKNGKTTTVSREGFSSNLEGIAKGDVTIDFD